MGDPDHDLQRRRRRREPESRPPDVHSPELSIANRRDTRLAFDPKLAGVEVLEYVDDDGDADTTNETTPAATEERWLSTLAAGGVAGACSRTAVAPLERLKILFQVQGISAGGRPVRHSGILRSLGDLVVKDGVRGLWRGNGLNCVRVVPSSAIQFATYALYKRTLFGDDGEPLRAWQLMVAGGLAGATSTTCTYPIDLMRARRTVDFRGEVDNGLLRNMANLARAEGVRGLFRGLLPSLCGIIPYIGIDFAIFDILKRRCRERGVGLDDRGEVHPLTKVACGAAAGVCGMTVAFPFDTVRRNLQVATLKVRGGGTLETTMAGTLRAITRDWTMPLNLYRGLGPNYAKAAPSVGISFATFEYVKDLLDSGAS